MANIYIDSTAGGAANGTTWADAYLTCAAAEAKPWTNADTVWVAENHAESTAAAITVDLPTTPGMRLLCGDSAAEPPTALATTGSVSTTGANGHISFSGHAYIYGIVFNCSSAANAGNIRLPNSSGSAAITLDSCKFTLVGSNAANTIGIGDATSATNKDCMTTLINPVFKFAGVGQSVQLRHGNIRISGATIDAAGSAPTTLFTMSADAAISAVVEASDLSGKTWTNLISQS
ncbi:MAG: hypothetical protein ACREUV_10825, partial [Burkholderiales bacterium]